jgi:hypothetical protein
MEEALRELVEAIEAYNEREEQQATEEQKQTPDFKRWWTAFENAKALLKEKV